MTTAPLVLVIHPVDGVVRLPPVLLTIVTILDPLVVYAAPG